MGMLRSYMKLVLLMHKRRHFTGSVCVLGNQEIWAGYEGLKQCFDEMGMPYRTPRQIAPHSSRMFEGNPALRALSADFVHASVFFEMMGMDEYVDIDKFAIDRPVIQHDLNQPIGEELRGRFGLTIDGGTAEHIFDVRAVFENLVAMTKVGGHVLHISTFQPDHGFYAFSPALFFELYLANGFVEPECYLMYVDYRHILKTYAGPHPYRQYVYGETVLEQGSEIPFMVFFAAKKMEKVEKLKIPTQGVFARMASSEGEPRGEVFGENESLYERVVPPFARRPLSFLRPIYRGARSITSRVTSAVRKGPSLPRI